MKINLLSFFITFFILLIFPNDVFARSGCCSWHGGVCGCGCCDGTPLSATCAPYYSCDNDYEYTSSFMPYVPACSPKSTVGKSGNWTFTKNGCNQNVTITWDKGVADETYSIGISKTAGADPGPKPDTDNRSWTFYDIKPGKWYINIKAGQTCGWGDVYYWRVDVPSVEPTLNIYEDIISETNRELHINSQCASSVTISPSAGYIKPGNSILKLLPKKDVF